MIREMNEGGRGLAPGTVKVIRNVLMGAFSYAVDEKLIAENPVSRTKLPPIRESKANSLTIEQAKAFISVKNNFWYGDAFVFQLHTGLRPQELMALIWEDIDFEQGTVRIERACKWIRGAFTGFGPTKSKRSNRIIELAPAHLELLQLHFEKQQKIIEDRKTKGSPYGEQKIKEWAMKERPKQAHLYASAKLVFPKSTGAVPSITNPRKEFKDMLQQAGITGDQSNIRWYDLRHTHASILLTKNEPHHEIAERMGHSVNMLLNTYAHVLKSRRGSGSALIAELIPVESNQTHPSTEKNVDPESNK